jgi:NAD(P)-dependent dehydrogenase (short-subunit alcohol dehydrogenase family)
MVTSEKHGIGLAGRVCVVTGGGTGIGRDIAAALAGEGAAVAILDWNEVAAKETLELVLQAGAEGLAVTCDVSSQDSVEAACTVVQRQFGDTQVLINNAAIRQPGALASLPLAEWNALLAVNLTGYFLCAQVFGHAMRAKGDGVLVHVASVAGDQAIPCAGAYSVAKAGVTMLSRLLAVEWGPDGVRSNVVHPGIIYTPSAHSVYDHPEAVERRAQAVPSRRIGQPQDIAQAVLFLASPRASYVNGAELVVDGGFTRNLMSFVPRAGYGRSNT